MGSFRQWLSEAILIDANEDKLSEIIYQIFGEMAEVPNPDPRKYYLKYSDYGYHPPGTRGTWRWLPKERGGKAAGAYTAGDPNLNDPHARHSAASDYEYGTSAQFRDDVPPPPPPQARGRAMGRINRQPAEPVQPPQPPAGTWICAFLKGDKDKYAIQQQPGGGFEVRDMSGNVYDITPDKVAEMKNHFDSYRPDGKNAKMVATPEEWFADQEAMPAGLPQQPEPDTEEVEAGLHDPGNATEPTPEPTTKGEPQKFVMSKTGQKIPEKALIPEDLISEEQRDIRDHFEKIMGGNEKSHMMIDALAGSGKTTMLRHLAWEYGKPGQKWLYLVFNNRNKVEAEDKFPPWVEVKTTNSFLGTLLETEENLLNIPLTQRIISLAQRKRKQAPGQGRPQQKGARGKDAKSLDKSRIIADGPQFAQVMQDAGIPSGTVDLSYESDAVNTVINYICLQSLQVRFKNEVVKLVGLAKSFALDVRNQEKYQAGMQYIFDKYDIDTQLSLKNISYGESLKGNLNGSIGLKKGFLNVQNICGNINEAPIAGGLAADLRDSSKIRYNAKLKVGKLELEPVITPLVISKHPFKGVLEGLEFNAESQTVTLESPAAKINGDLKASFTKLSIPTALKEKSFMANLILTPIETIASIGKYLPIKYIPSDLSSAASIFTDYFQNFDNVAFDTGEIAATAKDGLITIGKCEFKGTAVKELILTGTIRGSDGAMNTRARTKIGKLIVPLRIKGVFSSPSTEYSMILPDFLEANAGNLLSIKNIGDLLKTSGEKGNDSSTDKGKSDVEEFLNLFKKKKKDN